MGGKTSATTKNKWISRTYDRINLTVPKGQKAIMQAYAAENGESVNGMLNRLIDKELEKRAGE